MSDLPPGFVLDKKPTAAAALPPGFVLDKPSAAAEAPKPEDGNLSVFDRLWRGLSGKDVTLPGRIGMGMADPVMGVGQLLSRGPAIESWDESTGQVIKPDMEATRKRVDTEVQQREQRYQTGRKAAGDKGGEGFFGDIWRTVGNIASPVTVGAGLAAGAAAPASVAGRLGASAALGAVTGASEPVTGGNFAAEKAKQTGLGAVAGTAGGALGELVSSTLGKALAGNNTAAIDRYLTGSYKQTVRPGRMPGVVGSPQLKMQDNRILSAVDTMTNLAKSGQLQLTDEAGQLLPQGTLPRTLRQFSEGIDDAKRTVFQQYDQMAHQTGQQGIQIGLMPIVNQLRQIASGRVTKDVSPALAKDATQIADNFEARLFYTPSEMQDAISLLNREVTKDIKATGFSPIKPVVDSMRQALDNTISSLQGPGYQALKTQYGALRSIEKDVANAAQSEAKKHPWGASLANFASAEEFLRGAATGDVKAIGTSVAIQAAKGYMRWLNNPNRAIAKLFQQRANPPGALRRGASAALEYSYAPGAILGEKTREEFKIPAPAGMR